MRAFHPHLPLKMYLGVLGVNVFHMHELKSLCRSIKCKIICNNCHIKSLKLENGKNKDHNTLKGYAFIK